MSTVVVDSSAVSDALDQLGLPGSRAAHLRCVSVPHRIAGRVITVTLEEADGRKSIDHLGTSAIDAAQAGDVIVVEHKGPKDVSGWGGLLSLGAKLRGVAGVIVDGACRDADEMVDLDFPVYARRTTPITARGRIIQTAWNQPIMVSGIAIDPGDYVIADRSGVVFVRAADCEAVLAAAGAIAEREAGMARALHAGKTIREALSSYETLLNGTSAHG